MANCKTVGFITCFVYLIRWCSQWTFNVTIAKFCYLNFGIEFSTLFRFSWLNTNSNFHSILETIVAISNLIGGRIKGKCRATIRLEVTPITNINSQNKFRLMGFSKTFELIFGWSEGDWDISLKKLNISHFSEFEYIRLDNGLFTCKIELTPCMKQGYRFSPKKFRFEIRFSCVRSKTDN